MDDPEDRHAHSQACPPEATPSEAGPATGRTGGHLGWLMAVAGAGLFLGGAILGAILALAVALYRQPAGPSAALPSPFSHGATAPAGAFVDRKEGLPAPSPSPSSTPSARPIGPKVGWEAPAFALNDLDGMAHSLAAYRGRTVLLHFWASWCLPCRAEWPELLAFVEQHGDGRFVLLAVNSEEPIEVVRSFVGSDPPPFPILLDSDGSVGRAYRLSVLPTTFVIGPDGIIRSVVPGNVGMEALEGLIQH